MSHILNGGSMLGIPGMKWTCMIVKQGLKEKMFGKAALDHRRIKSE